MTRLRAFQRLLHGEVPLTRHMDVRAEAYDGHTLKLAAELQPNINVHGTAFGGSLYSLAAVTAWGLLRLRMEDAGALRDIILGRASIDYKKPVRSRLIARAECGDECFEAFSNRIRRGERARIEVEVDLFCEDDGFQDPAATFSGVYAVFLESSA